MSTETQGDLEHYMTATSALRAEVTRLGGQIMAVRGDTLDSVVEALRVEADRIEAEASEEFGAEVAAGYSWAIDFILGHFNLGKREEGAS